MIINYKNTIAFNGKRKADGIPVYCGIVKVEIGERWKPMK